MAKPKAPARPKIAPELPQSTSRRLAPYVSAIGQAAVQWNVLHEALAVLFSAIMQGGHNGQYLGVWSAVANDRSKRQMLLAAARAMWIHPDDKDALARHELVKEKIKSLVRAADALEETRNNVVHAPLYWEINYLRSDYGRVAPLAYLSNVRAQKLSNKDLLQEYRWCREYAIILGNFALQLSQSISHPELGLPEIPRAPNREQKMKGRGSLPRRKTPPTPPPRSSLA